MEYSLSIRTVQTASIKTLVEALKELLTDVVIEADSTGLRIVAMDTARVVLVHLRLDAEKFEFYDCPAPLNLGVNMLNLHKLLKSAGSSDTLTLYVERGDANHLGIKIESLEKNSRTVLKLNLLDMEPRSISVGATTFEDVIVLPAAEFQKLCRDMHCLAESVEIRVVRDEVSFRCQGDFSSQETVLGNGCLRKNEDEESAAAQSHARAEIVQGCFSLRYLCMFTRCTALSSTVALFLRNDYPLILRYGVGVLGEIKLVCAPQSGDAV